MSLPAFPRIQSWRSKLQYLRLRPFDTSSEEGRAAERHRRMALTAAAGFAAKLLSAAISLLTVPLTIGYLGNERYGLWLAVSSLVAMMSFADLGIGNGLLTRIAQADGEGDRRTIRVLISNAFFVLAGIACLLACLTVVSAQLVDWPQVLGVTSAPARNEVRSVVVVLALTFFLSMPFGVAQRVQQGLQSGYAYVLWTMAGSVVTLVALLIATSLHLGLVPLVLALSGAPTLVTIVNFAWYFGFARRDACPRVSDLDHSTAVQLLRTGALFVLLQLAAAFAFLSDNIVVARSLGADSVPDLAVPAKLFALLTLPVQMISAPLWPAYGAALSGGDADWVKRTLERSVRLSVGITAVSCLALIPIGGWLVQFWSKGAVSVGFDVLVPLALWTCFSAWGTAVAALLNGAGRIREQAAAAVVMATVAFALKWVLIGRFGISGVVWATVAAYFLFTFLPVRRVVRDTLRRAAHGSARHPARSS